MTSILPIKINPLDAHDRLKEFTSRHQSISECCQDLINKAPFGNRPFYIFAHARTDDDGFTKRIIWQPRLTKPKAQTNSMLFKAHPGTDVIVIVWMIPERSLWKQYNKGNMTQNKLVYESIQSFIKNRAELEKPDDDDPSDEMVNHIYTELAVQAKYDKLMANRYQKV